MSFFDFFSHPLLRAPTWGTLFMCIGSSLMGVLILLKKRSLLSETLSHSAYPGAILGAALFAAFSHNLEEWSSLPIFGGALISSFLALKMVEALERKKGVGTDAALSFVLALFLGGGVLLASGIQSSFPKAYQNIQMLLFGQVATMTDLQAGVYGFLALFVVLFLWISFRPLQALLFDRGYTKSLGINVKLFEKALFWLLLFSLIIGMRSVGIVLMSGMLIAPAAAARQFSNRLRTVLWLSAFFGALSGLIGNILSVELSLMLSKPEESISIPTGPLIVLTGSFFALFSLAFAPKRGLFFRMLRAAQFRFSCLGENILKGIWKKGTLTRREVQKMHQVPLFLLSYSLFRLSREGWVQKRGEKYSLTQDGTLKAKTIVRLHRLWELYLTEELGVEVEKVHRNAEEMEHILTPEIEERLTRLLLNPQKDPHQQPIPERSLWQV